MAHTEEDLVAVVRHTVPGKGAYPFYKWIFTHVARSHQPDSLRYVWSEMVGEPVADLDKLEDYDVIAMIAWSLSLGVYYIYKDWREVEGASYVDMVGKMDALLGTQAWAPSLAELAEGRFL